MNASTNQFASWWQRVLTACGQSLLRLLVGLVALIASCGGTFAGAAEPEAGASQIKAAFLLNFPKYVDWPAESYAAPHSPIVVVILGDPAVADEFAKIIVGKTIQGRSLILKALGTADRLPQDCHILFVSKSVPHAAELLAPLRTASILTVGDAEDFLENGGAIRLAERDQKIRLEVNLGAASGAQLKLSSKLLSVATVVKGAPQ